MENKKDISKMTIDYHTYKNKLLETYPESLIDIQLVFDGDDFNFSKESGKIIYNHKINNPFAKDKKAIGGYCVIKNRMGEFLEIMNDTEIQKCKQVAKMKNIWNTWETEMYLKTIMKRACKRFFHDIVKEIEDKDNEDYDLSKLESPITEEQKKIIDGFDKIKLVEFAVKRFNRDIKSVNDLTEKEASILIWLKK